MRYEFSGPVWRQDSTGAWRFVSLPKEVSDRIRAFAGKPKVAFGSLRVKARIGKSSWETSIFPDAKRGVYLLPLKADVRRREDISDGDQVQAAIELALYP